MKNDCNMKLKNIPYGTVVHTTTEEETKELLAILHENGWKWIEFSGEEDDITYWDRYEHKTCYNLKPGKIIDTEEYDFYADEGYTILTLADFKRLYCEEEKPQPKFKVGDRVWAKIYQAEPPYIGTVTFIRKDKDYEVDIDAFSDQINKQVWCCRASDLEPYTEPKTKEETMETKENRKMTQDVANCDKLEDKGLNLCELLAHHIGEMFYSPCFGELTLRETDCDYLLLTTARGINERFNLDGRLWTAVSTAVPILYPSRALYEQYPLDPLTAWMKWQKEQRLNPAKVIINKYNKNGGLIGEYYRSNPIDFRTPADRYKCIEVIDAFLSQIQQSKSVASLCEEIKEIIEKYSKK